MNNGLLKERERLYKRKCGLRESQFNVKKKSQSIANYSCLERLENKHEFYDKFIKALSKSERS